MSFGLNDIREILIDGGEVQAFDEVVRKALKGPPLDVLKHNPTALLATASETLEKLVRDWTSGQTRPVASSRLAKLVLRPVVPHGRHVASDIESAVDSLKPDVVAIDSPVIAGVGAAAVYAFSLHNGVGVPAFVEIVPEEGYLGRREVTLFSGGMLESAVTACHRKGIPLVPVGSPVTPTTSRTASIFQDALNHIYQEFDQSLAAALSEKKRESLAKQLFQKLWGLGIASSEDRERVIYETTYLASRVADLSSVVGKKSKRARLLVLVQLDHYEDFAPLVKQVFRGRGVDEELYCRPQKEMTLKRYSLVGRNGRDLWETARERGPEVTTAQRLFEAEFKRWMGRRRRQKLSRGVADDLIAQMLQKTRNHTLIDRGASVRGSIALREVAQGYARMGGRVNIETLEKAAMVALPHRVRLSPSADEGTHEIVRKIVLEVLYGIRLGGEQGRKEKDGSQPLTKESLRKALEGLADVSLEQFDKKKGEIPSFDPSFIEEIMNHPLVKEALKNARFPSDLSAAYQKMLDELEQHGALGWSHSDKYRFTEKGLRELAESLQEKLARGEITEEDLKQALSRMGQMPLSSSGLPVDFPKEKMTELLAELMDAQHQGRAPETSLEDVYVHYMLSEKRGVKTDPDKLDYHKLQVMVHELQKRGLLELKGSRSKGYSLTSRALMWLLEELIPKGSSHALVRSAFKKGFEPDKSEVRRYRRGDVFRDISVRHTLREVVRQRKTLEEVGVRELRAFEKKPLSQLDIVLCVDVSASMKDQAKLRYAKMAVAGLAKAALEKGHQVGVISFSNTGEMVIPLTDKAHAILEGIIHLRAHQYTNVGHGLKVARETLLKSKSGNKKHVILISDGLANAATPEVMQTAGSMEKREVIGTQYALVQSQKARDSDIKISVLLITHQDRLGEWLAKQISKVGKGKFYRVRTMEEMPLDALAMVQ
jgi:Mg-chelatase subunit ChlD